MNHSYPHCEDEPKPALRAIFALDRVWSKLSQSHKQLGPMHWRALARWDLFAHGLGPAGADRKPDRDHSRLSQQSH